MPGNYINYKIAVLHLCLEIMFIAIAFVYCQYLFLINDWVYDRNDSFLTIIVAYLTELYVCY